VPHFGDQMDGIGRRFERLGRAGLARRWQFARYEVEEIRESFEDLEKAPVPEDLQTLDVPRLVKGLITTALPVLDSALVRQDSSAFDAAFRLTAQECNACHRSARRDFVQIPLEPGVPVPVLTPVSPAP